MIASYGWLFWTLLGAAFAALMTIFAKIGLKGIDPDAGQLGRTAVVLLATSLLLLFNGKWHTMFAWSGRTWTFLILSGLATAASWLCYFRALDVGPASRVAAVDKLSIVLVAVFAAAFLQERIGMQGWLGIALVVAGLTILSLGK